MKVILYLYSKKAKKDFIEECMFTHCNPGCKDTIFEPDDPNHLPAGVLKRYKDKDLEYKNRLLQQRQEYLGSKKNVLDTDSYYKNATQMLDQRKNARSRERFQHVLLCISHKTSYISFFKSKICGYLS